MTPEIQLLLRIGTFVLGASIGSFLNVVIARLPAGESVVHPRSRCPKCGRMITWWQNIPILSWVILRGKCAGCGLPISIRYPVVELVTGALFLACLERFGLSWGLLPAWILSGSLIAITFIDIDIFEIPDEISLPGIVLGCALRPLCFDKPWISGIVGAAAGAGALWFVRWAYEAVRKREGMGLGDLKLLAMIGAFLGPAALLPTVLVGSFAGSLIGLTMAAVRRVKGQEEAGEEAEEEAQEEEEEEEIDPTWRCRACSAELPRRWKIPLFALALGKRACPDCGEPLRLRWPVVELGLVTVLFACLSLAGFTWATAPASILAIVLVAAIALEPDPYELPELLFLLALVLGGVVGPLLLDQPWFTGLFGPVVGAGLAWLVRWPREIRWSREIKGYGDIKTLAVLGAFVGPSALVRPVLIGGAAGILIAVVLRLVRRNGASDPEEEAEVEPEEEEDFEPTWDMLPFGPFLALGAIASLLFEPAFQRLIAGLGPLYRF